MSDLEKGFVQIVQDYQEYATDSTSEPAAPDTSKFRATRGGMIQGVRDLDVPAPKYGFPRNFVIAIKVGSNVDHELHVDIADEVKELVADSGLKYIETHGTAWSAYGVSK